MTINQMKSEDYLENSYWNHKGKYQKEYDEMLEAEHAGTFKFTKTTLNTFHSYYRFYNDGDTPTSYRYYAEKYQEIIEARVDERIVKEYKRFIKESK